jgi:hypothetical protein
MLVAYYIIKKLGKKIKIKIKIKIYILL